MEKVNLDGFILTNNKIIEHCHLNKMTMFLSKKTKHLPYE